MSISINRKLNFIEPNPWNHHRHGWRYVSDAMLRQLHTEHGTYCYHWADRLFRDQIVLTRPWTGFMHNVVTYPERSLDRDPKLGRRQFSLEELIVDSPEFQQSLPFCKGLFTLSSHTANFLSSHLTVPVSSLLHPGNSSTQPFSFERFSNCPMVVTIGQWRRKILSINQLDIPYQRAVLCCGSNSLYQHIEEDVLRIEYLTDHLYDDLLSKSVVFLDLYDVAACNTVIECIMANTPIVINRHPANMEYLGVDYPLFYDTIEQASSLLSDIGLIAQTSLYLQLMDKSRFELNYFIEEMANSDVYSDLICCKVFK